MTDNDINAKHYTQAANSPDVNLLDLGFFRAIQSFNDATPKHEEELIELVSVAYENYPRLTEDTLNMAYLTMLFQPNNQPQWEQ